MVALIGVSPLAAQSPPRPAKVTIQPGDTLSDIAVRFYGSAAAVERILTANGLDDADLIVAGNSITLPSGENMAAALVPAPASGAARPTTAAANTRQVVVEPGDTLSGISLRVYGTAVHGAALATANGLSDVNTIIAGMKLAVPPAPATTAGGGGGSGASGGRGGVLGSRRICLDPGHGGVEEPGAVYEFGDGKLLREADITLDITRTLRAWLQADGAAVTMTRGGDSFLGLDERAGICNAAGADITVSIHLNSMASASWNGAVTLYTKPADRNLAERLFGTLQSGLSRNAPGLPFTAFGAQPFDGRVLLRTAMPAVIVEPVFLSNPGEARALQTPITNPNSRRNQIVLEIYRGIRMYFGQ